MTMVGEFSEKFGSSTTDGVEDNVEKAEQKKARVDTVQSEDDYAGWESADNVNLVAFASLRWSSPMAGVNGGWSGAGSHREVPSVHGCSS